MTITIKQARELRILVSALAAKILEDKAASSLRSGLMRGSEVTATVLAIAQTFGKPDLIRSLNLTKLHIEDVSLELEFQDTQVSYQEQVIGQTKILFKSPLPGELQARLAIESAIDRFLEYLQKVHQIVALDESDRHVQLFIPNQPERLSFEELWKDFLEQVAFSTYGLQKYQLPGLAQTFISMLKSITLSDRGFSTLEVPVLNREQANVLAAWYFAVWRETKKRQDDRQKKIYKWEVELECSNLSEKERKSKEKQLQEAYADQQKEYQKYQEKFQKPFSNFLDAKKTTDQGFASAKFELLSQSRSNPLDLVDRDCKQNPEKFREIIKISNNFNKTSADQIAGVKGDIFAKCIVEMYRLLEITDEQFDPLPTPLLTEEPVFQSRSPGDDSKEFCYSCGVVLNPKAAKWQVRRLIFESPEQRRQSASDKGRPHICASCAALAFASPLKLTDESIVLKLEPISGDEKIGLTLKDYLRMLTSKELHLSSGKYIVLASDKTQRGDAAAQKLGQVQYALAKVASIFPVEVLSNFRFSLMTQGSESIPLASRHLIFIKGLMECYKQSIVIAGKDFNLVLGDAIRYVQQDLPCLADYTITRSLSKDSKLSSNLELEQVRSFYWQTIQADLILQGDTMDSNNQLPRRARLYRDIAALTGLTFAFASSLENTAKKLMKDEDAEREVKKLIEKVDDAVAFGYYASLGDENKTKVEARLWRNPENYFIYEQAKELLKLLGITDREEQDKSGKTWLKLYADDLLRVYQHYSAQEYYKEDKDWRHLTYQLELSLYTRFPELVRKLKSTGDK